MIRLLFAVGVLALYAPLHAEDEGGGGPVEAKSEPTTLDWSVPVPGYQPIKPGEHPRMLFRAQDLPRLKKRAASPEGKAILARLDTVLDGKWTLWHGAGYGLKYILTGDKQWAEKAKESTDKAISGTSDLDGRYSFTKPGSGGPMRAGPAMGAVALAYDLAYEGWDPAYRQQVAKAIADNPWLAKITSNPPCGLGCNHFGAAVGGAGEAAVGIWGDPGIDQAKVDGFMRKLLQHERNEMQVAWSPYSYFYEGHQCGRISASGAVPFLVAWRTAFAQDWLSDPRSHYRWLGMRWVAETIKAGKGLANPQRGMYARNFPRDGMVSQNGEFARAFAIADPKHLPALKWFYNRILEPGEKTYDIIVYPQYAAWALQYWPMEDVSEQNPGEIIPKVWADPGPGYFTFRNGFTADDQEILVTCIFGQKPTAGRSLGKGGVIHVAGLGRETFDFPGIFWCSKVTQQYLAKDGSGIVSGEMSLASKAADGSYDKLKAAGIILPGISSLAVDYSGAGGVPLVLVMTGPQVGLTTNKWITPAKANGVAGDYGKGNGAYGKVTVVEAGGTSFAVMTFTKGEHPLPKAVGPAVVVGDQRITFDGKQLVLAKIAERAPAMPR